MPQTASFLPVSVVFPVRNEELNIGAALATVGWSDDIWVVDSQSTDRTAAIATEMGGKVVQFHYLGHGPKKMNWSLENLSFKYEWVFFLDADERVPAALVDEIRTGLARHDVDGFFVDREYIFLGKSIRCFRPDWNMRLWRHRLGRFEMLGTNVPATGDVEVHEHVVIETGRIAYFTAALLHEDRRPIRSWVDNHNRYSEWEAEVYRQYRAQPLSIRGIWGQEAIWRKRMLKKVWVRLPMRPLARFFIYFVLRKGFLDGRVGFDYSVAMAFYEFMINLKLHEADLQGRLESAADGGRATIKNETPR